MSVAVDSEPLVSPEARPRRRPLRRRLMHWLRRIHLYTGLLLIPWALLYGVTGFLFNHPEAFSDQPAGQLFGSAEIQDTPLANLPAPAELAAAVVERLKAQHPDCRLVRPEQAGYRGDNLVASARSDGAAHTVFVSLSSGTGSIRSRPGEGAKAEAPFATRKLTLDRSLPQLVQEALPTILERKGLKCSDVTILGAPDLTFFMEKDDQQWRVSYNWQRGTVTGQPAGVGVEPFSTRRYLLRLHLARGYPAKTNARWFWAVAVDVMAGAMVLWALWGLFMWWQIKAVRILGALTILLSLALATWLALGMHQAFKRG